MGDVLPRSGDQWTLRHGEHKATVVEVGGGLRTWTYRGEHLLAGYAEDEQCSAGRGQLLMPWPSRIRDGRYTFAGSTYQLALSEPGRGNASHGLVRWVLWRLRERTDASVTVGTRLLPQPGWGWSLDLQVTYALDDDGLTVTPLVTNIGDADAPFGFGAHPYFTLGEELVDELELTVPARTRLLLDAQRLLPSGREDVTGSAYDLRAGGPIGTREIDMAYTDVRADDDGRWRAVLRRPATGRSLTVWADAAAYPWVVVFTADSLAPRVARRCGVAVEPMSCPPDAFNSGDDLVVIPPGGTWSAAWGATVG